MRQPPKQGKQSKHSLLPSQPANLRRRHWRLPPFSR